VSKTFYRILILASAFAPWGCSNSDPDPIGGSGGSFTGSGGSGDGTGGTAVGVGGTLVGTGGATSNAGGGPSNAGGGPANTGGGGSDGTGGGTTSPDPTVHLEEAGQRQLIRGFGINNNWAALEGNAARLFGNGEGQLGLNILRVGMGQDGEPYNGSSCYTDINNVVTQTSGRDEPHYIMATLWTPPTSCKSNTSISDGGHLETACYDSWSTTIANFADKIAENTNTTLYAMSPQNEADFASCGFDEPCNGHYDTTEMYASEAVAFQKIVGPKLRAKGVIPMSPEASEWIHVWSNISATGSVPSNLPSSDPFNCGCYANTITAEVEATCAQSCKDGQGYDYGHALYKDAEAWAQFDIMGTHQYDSQVAFAWPADVPQGDKEVWQTEMSGVKWWPEQGALTAAADNGMNGGQNVVGTTTIENGVAVARWVHSGLVVGEANAWLWWWYESIGTDDNEGLVTKSGETAKRFYTFGQFTKFIRPGYHRVDFTGNVPDKVLISAYKSDDGKVVIVAINETTTAQTIPITISGGTAPAMLKPYVTATGADNIAGKDAVPVTEGILQAALPAMSVTTYVTE
jgi:O-glycosyl hydrolase